jgi:hypothetical protein
LLHQRNAENRKAQFNKIYSNPIRDATERKSEQHTFSALHVMYGTYEGVTLSGKPSGTTYDLMKFIISCDIIVYIAHQYCSLPCLVMVSQQDLKSHDEHSCST